MYFLHSYDMDLKRSPCLHPAYFSQASSAIPPGALPSDWLLRRTGRRDVARRNLVVFGMLGAMLSLLPLLFTPNLVAAAVCLSLGFFFAELTIGPMWAIPMDIAPQYSGVASGLMNVGSAFAAIVSRLSRAW
jgi:MFS family permease